MINKIDTNLYISDYQIATDLHLLQELNITQIIALGNEDEQRLYSFFEEIEYLQIIIEDNEDTKISDYFELCEDFINKNTNNTLIFCCKGISRSATIAIFHFMKKKLTYEQSYKKLKKLRPIIKPNKGFVQQLKSI